MTDLLEEIRSQAAREQLPILRDAELPVMTRILRQARPERLLEVGTCIGYSALIMAPFLKEEGTLTTIELGILSGLLTAEPLPPFREMRHSGCPACKGPGISCSSTVPKDSMCTICSC